MTFLALSPFAVTLLAVFTASALIAMYFLKVRHRRMVIASSLLWSRVLDRREERSMWEKLRRLMSMLLVVIVGLLIVFAVARPQVPALTGTAGRRLIVLDTSPSMLTRMNDGRTRWQHAVDVANRLVVSSGPGSEFRVADTSGRLDSPFTDDVAQAKCLIETLRPVAASPRFPDVDETEAEPVETYFISDGVTIPAVPPSAKKLIVYEAAQNTGITAFEVRSMPSTPLAFEAYLEVTNFGKETRKTTINITEGGPGRISREAQIQPGQSFGAIFDLAAFEGGGIRTVIQTDGDALSADDVAYSYLPFKKKAKTLLATKGNEYLQTALRLDSFVDLSVVTPAEYREDPNIDTYIFDGFAPAVQPAKPALVIGAQSAPWLRASTGTLDKPAFTTWTEGHPVMQYLSLHDVSIAKASIIDASNLTVLAASGQTPLIVASPPGAASARWIMLTFDLQASDFPLHESFPVFVDNALAWFGRERLALRRTTGMVEIPLVNAQISGPDGKPVASHGYLDRTVFDAPAAGLYVATKDNVRLYIAVNLLGPQYSNVNHADLNWGAERPESARVISREPWIYLLFLAVVLLGLEWVTYHRRITL